MVRMFINFHDEEKKEKKLSEQLKNNNPVVAASFGQFSCEKFFF